MLPDLQGERQFGPYRLAHRIATGGMAEIYLAKTRGIEGFEKYVALKMIHPNFSSDDHFIQMLIDEAKISVQLQHVNIAHTFDLGRVGDTYYIAMEYVDGSDLFRILRKASEQDRYMPIEMASYIAKEVAAGLDYAHRKRDPSGRSMGIVHRDISPQNVLISTAGEVKIVDFGIAKATMRAKQTAVGVIKGKYYYMSPEQAWGDPLDLRTDIFSAGILLYEMLTGQMLYLEEDMSKLLEMVRRADIPPPSTKRREIPRELDRIVMRALSKKPDLRWQSAQDYGTELEKFLHSYAPDFTPSRLAGFTSEVMGPTKAPAPAPAPPPSLKADPQATRGIERKSIVLSRSEFTDENSVIFSPGDLGGRIADPPPPPPKPPAPRQGSTTRPMAAHRQIRETNPMQVTRPPPLPPKLPPKLAARLASHSRPQPVVDPGTIDIGDDELEAVPDDDAKTETLPADRTTDLAAAPHEPMTDEDPTVLNLAGLAKARVSTTRPMEAPPPPAPAPPAPRASSSRPVVAEPVVEPPAPPRISSSRPAMDLAAPRITKRTPLAVPVLEAAPPPPAPPPVSSSLPLAAPVESVEEQRSDANTVPTSASTIWPARVGEDEADDFLGLKIGARFGKRHLIFGLLMLAGALGVGALIVSFFTRPVQHEYATVDVISIPAGARVFVDKTEFGVTPLPLEKVALNRDFMLRVELPQYEPWSRSLKLTVPEHTSVMASLKPILGELNVESTPSGAEVFVNNRSLGPTPLKRIDQNPFIDGTIEVRKAGYKPSRQPLEWKGQRKLNMIFELQPAKD